MSVKTGVAEKKIEDKYPDITRDLERLVSPETRGDPESPLRWTTKSTQNLAEELQNRSYEIKAPTVGRILKSMGYSLQANCKTKEGKNHPDRDAQFIHINKSVAQYQSDGIPTVSVDCKKKELIGDFKNNGQEWMPKGQPESVRTHDFPIPSLGKGIPYGIYDPLRNEGFVNVGNDHETSVFAAESIRRWTGTVTLRLGTQKAEKTILKPLNWRLSVTVAGPMVPGVANGRRNWQPLQLKSA